MASVYLVTRGEYSDYSILAAFSTKEGAEAAVEVINQEQERGYQAEVEEFELDAFVDHYQRSELLYGVLMWRNGSSYDYTNYIGEERTLFGEDTRNGPFVRVERWATSKEAVVKIANEFRTQKIASGEWV